MISRELKRNSNSKGKYSFGYAQDMSDIRKERMKKPRKLNLSLRNQIIEMINNDWSPQQING